VSDYLPQPGTIPARVVDYFARLPRGHEVQTGVLVDALDQPSSSIITSCKLAIECGLIAQSKRDGRLYWSRGPKAPALSLVDVPAFVPPSTARADRRAAMAPRPAEAAPKATSEEANTSPKALQIGTAETPAPGQREAAPQEDTPASKQEPEPPAAPAPRVHDGAVVVAPGDVLFQGSTARRARAARAPRAAAAPACDSSMPAARPTRYALWSDGELVIDRAGEKPVQLSVDDTRGLLDYLDRLREVA